MDSVREIIRRYNVTPRKSLGQSFLADANSIAEIVEMGEFNRADTVVEIGAGLGVMTRAIAAQAGKVIALELDRGLVAILQNELKEVSNIDIVQTDVLKYDFSTLKIGSNDHKIKVTGNIPYYISSPIVFQLIDNRHVIDRAILTVQEEVAERLLAPAGSRAYGIPTVILAMYATITPRRTLSPQQFFPSPRVNSMVIEIKFRPVPLVELIDPAFFRLVVRTAFGKRRKTLLNNLKTLDRPELSLAQIVRTLEEIGIDGRKRAETIESADFGRLANALLRTLAKVPK